MAGSNAVAPPKNTANRSSIMDPNSTSSRSTKRTPSMMRTATPCSSGMLGGCDESGTGSKARNDPPNAAATAA